MSVKELYHQALVDPKDLTVEDFDLLIGRYPYSQPLYFAFERRKFLRGELDGIASKALFLAGSPSWLHAYVQLPVTEAPLLETIDDDVYVPFEEISPVEYEVSIEEQTEPHVVESVEAVVEKPVEQVVDERAKDEETPREEAVEKHTLAEEDRQTLDVLVQEGIGGGDYFSVHEREFQDDTVLSPSSTEEEDISLYNDELMPYSFRWWLHKTRLEYAETYQPFASPHLPIRNRSAFDPAELDRIIIDQQIRENIIHLQNPEDKLSDEVKQRTAEYNGQGKTAEVIERFIREEPQIQPPPAENLNTENKARKSSEEQFDLVTETLAAIYADQAMYVKAIEVYKKLILRFPEKKSYFATQIKELEDKLY